MDEPTCVDDEVQRQRREDAEIRRCILEVIDGKEEDEKYHHLSNNMSDEMQRIHNSEFLSSSSSSCDTSFMWERQYVTQHGDTMMDASLLANTTRCFIGMELFFGFTPRANHWFGDNLISVGAQ